MANNAHEDCYYKDASVCTGKTWVCIGCGDTYCEAHGHDTMAGINVECVCCERERMVDAIG